MYNDRKIEMKNDVMIFRWLDATIAAKEIEIMNYINVLKMKSIVNEVAKLSKTVLRSSNSSFFQGTSNIY